MKRVWRGGVAEGPCGGRSQKINKHMLQFQKIYNPVLGQEVIISQATKAWKLGMCLYTFVSFLGTRTSKSKKNCGCSKRVSLCNSWWVGDVCWSLPTCKGRVTRKTDVLEWFHIRGSNMQHHNTRFQSFNHLCTEFRLNLREVSDMNKPPD